MDVLEHAGVEYGTADCGHSYVPPGPRGGASGYAIDRGGETLCYPCAEAREVADFRATDHEWTGYLGVERRALTTWTGAPLAALVRVSQPDRRGTRSWRAVDVQGRRWYGRGTDGCCTLMRQARRG
jgi:hypothetical protein